MWLVFFVLRAEGGGDYLALMVRTKKTEGGDFCVKGKETMKGREWMKGLRSLGKVRPLFIGCGPGAVRGPRRAGVRKTVKSPEVLPGRGTRKCNGLRWE